MPQHNSAIAKMQIRHSCGHTSEYNQPADPKRRNRIQAYLRRVPCPACTSVQAAQAAREMGLPPLAGTAKQIAFAEQVRAKLWLAILDELRGYRASVTPQKWAVAEPRAQAKLKKIRAKTDAAWWLEHRQTEPMRVLKNA